MPKKRTDRKGATTLYIGRDTVAVLERIRASIEDGGPRISASAIADFCILQEARRRGLVKGIMK